MNIMNDEMKCMCKTAKDAKNRVKQTAGFLKGITLKNKADIDFQVKSSDRVKPLFSFKNNFDSEYNFLTVFGTVLGVMLLAMLIFGGCGKCSNNDGDEDL